MLDVPCEPRSTADCSLLPPLSGRRRSTPSSSSSIPQKPHSNLDRCRRCAAVRGPLRLRARPFNGNLSLLCDLILPF